jgi:hypothetical protein
MVGVVVLQALEVQNLLNIFLGHGRDGSVVTLLATIKMIVTPKEASEEVGLFDIVEALGNDRTNTSPTNEPRILSTHNNIETVNTKLTLRVSGSISPRTSRALSESFSKQKLPAFGYRGSSGSQNGSDVSAILSLTERSIFDKSVSASPCG